MSNEDRISRLEARIAQLEAERDKGLRDKTRRLGEAEAIVSRAEEARSYNMAAHWKATACSLVGHGLSDIGLHELIDLLINLDRASGKLPLAEDPMEALASEVNAGRKR